MSHTKTLVLLERSPEHLVCAVELSHTCSHACSGCSQSRSAPPSVLSLPTDLFKATNLKATPTGDTAGTRFQLEAGGEMLIALSSLVYLSPVVLMLLFCVVCSALAPGHEGWIAISAAFGLGIGLAVICWCGDVIRRVLVSQLLVRCKA